ncbi:MAG: hypothetical protein AAGF74_07390 [Pseudomonadota bacterium]
MSDTDGFIDEVSEEVRREKLFLYMRRYGWIAILLVVLLVGGAAFNEFRKARAEAAAQALGDDLMAALELDDAAERAAALSTVTASNENAQLLVELLQSAEAARQDDPAAAAAALEALAASGDAPPLYRDLARIKRVLLLGDTMDPAERSATLEALATPGGPFRVLALEQQALMQIDAGDPAAATAIFEALLEDAEATQATRDRARQILVILGADAG